MQLSKCEHRFSSALLEFICPPTVPQSRTDELAAPHLAALADAGVGTPDAQRVEKLSAALAAHRSRVKVLDDELTAMRALEEAAALDGEVPDAKHIGRRQANASERAARVAAASDVEHHLAIARQSAGVTGEDAVREAAATAQAALAKQVAAIDAKIVESVTPLFIERQSLLAAARRVEVKTTALAAQHRRAVHVGPVQIDNEILPLVGAA